MYDQPHFLPAADQALVVELGDSISADINARVRDLLLAIEQQKPPGVIDLVPSYRSLLVQYDPIKTSYEGLIASVREIEATLDTRSLEKPKTVHLPTLYGGEYGPDLDFVAKHADLSEQEVIQLHSDTDYRVYMVGFSPGFPYLGGLDDRLATPRLPTPRTQIPAGSVGIAENQTGVYPQASPGGWRLIGRTPLKLFDPSREPPALLQAGDFIRFDRLESEDEYLAVQRDIEAGRYRVTVETVS